MLIEDTLFGQADNVEQAISRVKEHEPPDGYYVAFSGGKDSVAVLDIVKRAGVKYDAHYHLTTVDPPELVYFIREKYPDVSFDRPKESMWDLIARKRLPPTRQVRYCCEVLKEGGGAGRVVVTGVRARESARRAKRKVYEKGRNGKKRMFLHPIFDWMEEDVWEYIHERRLPYCKLYDEGFDRIGCIMCPLMNKRKIVRDMERYPKYVHLYRLACERSYRHSVENGIEYTNKNIVSGETLFKWWLGELDKNVESDGECTNPYKQIPLIEMTTDDITYT